MKLTEHFTLEELIDSQVAARRRIDNTPGPQALANLRRVAELLEQIRTAVGGKPVVVSSGFRSAALNAAVGGARESAHLKGLAADINVPGIHPKDLARTIIRAGLEFDQVIYEGTWVHVGLSERAPRGEVLTATFAAGGVIYSKGIV